MHYRLSAPTPKQIFFDILQRGVPLGIDAYIPACRVLFPPDAPDTADIPLQHCDSALQSAIDNADIVDELLQAELEEGWICLVPGGDEEFRCRYSHSAVQACLLPVAGLEHSDELA